MQEQSLLLIEDNPDDAALAWRAHLRSGVPAKLRIAASCREALDLLRTDFARELPRAVFLDLNMPECSGFDLLAKLRAQPSTRFLPVVVLTTSKEPVDIHRSYELGANGFVTKPLDFIEFSAVFGRMVRYWAGDNEIAVSQSR